MASFSYGLAKGLREPCSPYREAYYFGAELNEPSADGWNCLPELVSQTTNFDLSNIPEGREVLVALLRVSSIPSGRMYFQAEWFRNRDNKSLFTQDWSWEGYAGGWIYFYAYLGRVSWEINENGGYRVEFTVSGALSYFKVIQFEISGIREVEEPEPVPTGFMAEIVSRLNAVSSFFWAVEQEVSDWIYPFRLIGYFFYELSIAFNRLAWNFHDFAVWVYEISARAGQGLLWSTIWDLILAAIPNLEDLRDWFYDWREWVDQQIRSWWSVTQNTVWDWLRAYNDWVSVWLKWFDGLLADLRSSWDSFWVITWPAMLSDLGGLRSSWESFIAGVLPDLATWTGVGDLVESALRTWFPFYDDLVSLWSGIKEFFTDPEDWLYKSLDRIIERYW